RRRSFQAPFRSNRMNLTKTLEKLDATQKLFFIALVPMKKRVCQYTASYWSADFNASRFSPAACRLETGEATASGLVSRTGTKASEASSSRGLNPRAVARRSANEHRCGHQA